jgi:hypothetical protein
MSNPAPQAAPLRERYWPAWVFSVAFHSCVILALGVTLQGAPRGASEQPIRAAGIVLKRASAEGDVYVGEEDQAETAAVEQQTAESNSTLIQRNDTTTSESADIQPQVTPVSNPGAASDENRSKTSQPNAASGNRGSSTGGGYTKVSVFGVEGTGNKFVYVFDRSASMEGAPLAAAKRQLIESLKSLEDTHQFHIIFFNHRLRAFDITGGARRIAFGTERNKRLASNFVGGITADGGTDRFTALKQALAFRPDVVFFLTDADDPMSASEMADIERLQSRIGTAICVIEFGRTTAAPSKNFLTDLAQLSDGQYGYVDTTKLKP